MSSEIDPPGPRQPVRGLRLASAVAATLLAAGGIYLAWQLHQESPDYYRPARTALVTAQKHLAESYGRETVLLEQLEAVHRESRAAVDELTRAADLDPRNRAEIQALARRLDELQDARRLDQRTPDELRAAYHDLSRRVTALIDELENGR